MNNNARFDRKSRGSAMVLTIVVAVILTGLIVTLNYVAGAQSANAANVTKMDQAFYAAEVGAQRVAWFCRNGKMATITSPVSGTVNGYSYSTSWTTSGAVVNITSVGSYGTARYSMTESVTPPTSTPVLATATDFNNKNIDVTGQVMTGGNYTNAGTGSLTGDLVYFGTASNTGNVSGTVSKGTGTFQPLDLASIGNSLVAAAGLTYNGNQSNRTFDFTAVAGAHKVIYVNGSVTSPTFIGTGTLYVNGTVSLDGFGTVPLPINIFASGDITSSDNITMYGSLYTAGNWNRSKFSLTGMLYVQGTVQIYNNGQSTLVQSTVPWFDPRSPGGAASTAMTISNFTGPQP